MGIAEIDEGGRVIARRGWHSALGPVHAPAQGLNWTAAETSVPHPHPSDPRYVPLTAGSVGHSAARRVLGTFCCYIGDPTTGQRAIFAPASAYVWATAPWRSQP